MANKLSASAANDFVRGDRSKFRETMLAFPSDVNLALHGISFLGYSSVFFKADEKRKKKEKHEKKAAIHRWYAVRFARVPCHWLARTRSCESPKRSMPLSFLFIRAQLRPACLPFLSAHVKLPLHGSPLADRKRDEFPWIAFTLLSESSNPRDRY